jgi:hypothetical protein
MLADGGKIAAAKGNSRQVRKRIGELSRIFLMLEQPQPLIEGPIGAVGIARAKCHRPQALESLLALWTLDEHRSLQERTTFAHVPAQPPEPRQDRGQAGTTLWVGLEAIVDQPMKRVVSLLEPVQPGFSLGPDRKQVGARGFDQFDQPVEARLRHALSLCRGAAQAAARRC